jgi:NADH:ubiquinone oxidoreductase subunit 5 (subunit L)/multisubunit Na+/H+ antiporter MnhA subunit
LFVLAPGALSATYGILQASVTSDLKRLLAYSTTENVGLMFLALGTAMLLRSHDVSAPADAALVACLLLLTSHAAFKTALFLGAGAVLHATGERDLDRMGGLRGRMPVTHAAFGLGALGAAALPVSVGFAAEWTLLQSLIHGARPDDRLVAATMPISVAVVALTAGLALLTFVKAYGIAFLARPRSSGATDAREATPSMSAAMLVPAFAVVGLGLVPGPLADVTGHAVGVADPGSGVAIDLPGIVGGVLDPVAVTLLAAVLAVPVGVVTLAAARRRRRQRVDLAWGCGGVRLSPRMQYTATSYAEPLARVFDDAIRPERDVVVTHSSESRYLVERVQFRQQFDEVVEARLYRPLLRVGDRVGVAARRLQNGSIHRYLGYSFIALVAVLVVIAL